MLEIKYSGAKPKNIIRVHNYCIKSEFHLSAKVILILIAELSYRKGLPKHHELDNVFYYQATALQIKLFSYYKYSVRTLAQLIRDGMECYVSQRLPMNIIID